MDGMGWESARAPKASQCRARTLDRLTDCCDITFGCFHASLSALRSISLNTPPSLALETSFLAPSLHDLVAKHVRTWTSKDESESECEFLAN
jgi:hypothetical protein